MVISMSYKFNFDELYSIENLIFYKIDPFKSLLLVFNSNRRVNHISTDSQNGYKRLNFIAENKRRMSSKMKVGSLESLK